MVLNQQNECQKKKWTDQRHWEGIFIEKTESSHFVRRIFRENLWRIWTEWKMMGLCVCTSKRLIKAGANFSLYQHRKLSNQFAQNANNFVLFFHQKSKKVIQIHGPTNSERFFFPLFSHDFEKLVKINQKIIAYQLGKVNSIQIKIIHPKMQST